MSDHCYLMSSLYMLKIKNLVWVCGCFGLRVFFNSILIKISKSLDILESYWWQVHGSSAFFVSRGSLGILSLQPLHVYGCHLLTSVSSFWKSFCFLKAWKAISDTPDSRVQVAVAESLRGHSASIQTGLVSCANQEDWLTLPPSHDPLIVPLSLPHYGAGGICRTSGFPRVLGPFGVSVICQAISHGL